MSAGRAATRRSKLCSIPAWIGAAAGTPKPPASSRRGQVVRQLHEREWIAAGFDDEPLDHLVVQRGREDGLEERPGVAMTERCDGDLRQPPRCVGHVARGEDHRDPFDREAASGEPEDLRRRAIEPVGVVDHAQKRPLLGGLRQQS